MFEKDDIAYVYCHNCRKLLFSGSIDEAVKIKCEDGHSYTCGKKSYFNMACPDVDTKNWGKKEALQFELYEPIDGNVIAGPVEASNRGDAAMELLTEMGYEVRQIQ